MTKVLVLYYSMYGHVETLATAIAEGARSVAGVEVTLKRVPETMPPDVAKTHGVKLDQAAPVASPKELGDYDAIIFGTPTRFGNMAAQMRSFWDQTAGLWVQGKLMGKLGGAFAGIGTQHGGHETTISSIWFTFAHHGMLIVPLGYADPRMLRMDEVTGGGPYGATTMSNVDGSRLPTENELAIAQVQGRRMAELAARLFG